VSFSGLAISLFRQLPPRLRERIKLVIGAGGHGKSFVDALRARQLAHSWKHPDALFPIVEEIIDTTGRRSLDGCRVMEYGSGFLMAEPLIYSMFGAAEVHAVDYLPLLQGDAFRTYAQEVDWRRYAEQVSERRGRDNVEGWISRLEHAARSPGDGWFQQLGIRYVAPFDILAGDPPAHGYDLIVSRSTLEHVPPELAQDIVTKLAALVKPGGAMYHYIHLADHRDIEGAPYAFLADGTDYQPAQHDLRGNRMRASDWNKIFAAIGGFAWNETAGTDDPALMPEQIGQQLRHYSRDDLLVSHYTIWGTRDAA
jgi:hypothetical protein